ncbi:flagellar export protein FliJ [Aporhodopirellula aestuarii]|uniref:Flagellar FliJ protein n=1 Tax=Aporhodopirellula aestuarii TaxID=2950107 RepID=A0ABT0U7A7_9BACT|nr:flagellar export protein FliJ [Aporhodopirellula aestuarii]MCM2372815.1 flagellar export protein FliJ [Aporhodopirellula aestuarii]
MPPFQFRFESLLSLRRRRRDEVGGEVGKATEAIRRVDEQIEMLQGQRDAVRAEAAERFAKSNGGGTTQVMVDRILSEGRYDLQLSADQAALRDTRAKLEVELNRRRGLLVEAEAEVKQLERLRETQMLEHRQLQLQAEQAEADDLTSARLTIAKRQAIKRQGGR